MTLEFGVFSFGDTYPHPSTGVRQSARDSLRDLLERIRLADELGFDYYGVGEHHRSDFSVSAVSTVLAAAASITARIRLGTATTVLTTDDPVRLYEQFATLDLLSGGRAELGVGSGVFPEPFLLFGGSLDERRAVFDDKLDLLLAIDENERVSYDGTNRPALADAQVWPRALTGHLDIWVAASASEASLRRAARLGLNVQTSATGSDLHELAPLVALYRAESSAHGWPAGRRRVAIGAHGIVDTDDRSAIDSFYPHYRDYVGGMRVNRGKPAPSRDSYDTLVADRESAVFAGSPQRVVDKILHQHAIVGHDRQLFQIDWRAVPQLTQLRTIELIGTQVLPAVRAELGGSATTHPSGSNTPTFHDSTREGATHHQGVFS